jgi:hypothetical protein
MQCKALKGQADVPAAMSRASEPVLADALSECPRPDDSAGCGPCYQAFGTARLVLSCWMTRQITRQNMSCCLCKRSSRQTTLVCVNAPRRNKRLPLPLHLAAEITDTCSPSLYISLLLAQVDNIIIHSYAHFGYVHHMNNMSFGLT